MGYRLAAGAISDRGLVRGENQDSFFKYNGDRIAVFCVADGMGGHAQGKLAADAVADGVRQWTEGFYEEKYENGFQGILEDFEYHLSKINRHIFQFYNKGQVCGSTIVALLVYGNYYAVFSVGDSRIYRKRGMSFIKLTKDDNWQNSNAVPYGYSEKEIRNNRNYDKLVKALGVKDMVIPFRMTDKLKRGDVFFLCSDGIYRYCRDEILRQHCRKSIWKPGERIETELEHICRYIKQKGAPDNLTAILVQVGGWESNIGIY